MDLSVLLTFNRTVDRKKGRNKTYEAISNDDGYHVLIDRL